MVTELTDEQRQLIKETYLLSLKLLEGPERYTLHGLPGTYLWSFKRKDGEISTTYRAYKTYDDCLQGILEAQRNIMREFLRDFKMPKQAHDECIEYHLKQSPWNQPSGKAREEAACNEGVAGVLKERGSTHGKFRDNGRIAQAIKRAIQSGPKYEELTDTQKEAMSYIAGKMSRIVSGNPDHADNWLDIQGFAGLILGELKGAGQ